MPWKIEKDTKACPANKPFAVKNANTGEVNGRCHATRESARQQQKLLYAKLERGEIKMEETYLAPLAFAEMDKELLWLEALPAKTWHTELYGEVPITEDKLAKMIHNFREGVRGQEIATNYEHGVDRAKGNKASGWFRDFDVRDGSLWAAVELTPVAREEIQNGEWKYFSLEWLDEWKHPETQEVYEDVIIGGGLTNNPIAKGMIPINFSELYKEVDFSESAVAEHRLEEHSEPGTGSPPEPRVEPPEKDAESGWRRESPPAAYDTEDNMEKELRELLALDENADVLEAVKDLHAKAEPLIKAEKEFAEKRSFAEMFPEEHRRMQMLETKNLETEARAFAESVARFTVEDGDQRKPTGKGYSQLVVDKIEGFVKAFSERNATLGDFREILEAIPNGIVDYSEHGSSRVAPTRLTETGDPKRAFGELVASIAEKDFSELPHDQAWRKAIDVAARQDPELFKASTTSPLP